MRLKVALDLSDPDFIWHPFMKENKSQVAVKLDELFQKHVGNGRFLSSFSEAK